MKVDYQKLNKVTPPIHTVVHNIATILERLTTSLGEYHIVLHLTNAFFNIPLSWTAQDMFVFTWVERQWTFQVLAQGYLHSSTICHVMVAQDLAAVPLPEGVHMEHYVNDIMLTSNDLSVLLVAIILVVQYLQE